MDNISYHGTSLEFAENIVGPPSNVDCNLGRGELFFLSRANFDLKKSSLELDINRRYTGEIHGDLINKYFILLEPNWKQLDKLFLERRVLFVDWK